jgi:hypothetical protein
MKKLSGEWSRFDFAILHMGKWHVSHIFCVIEKDPENLTTANITFTVEDAVKDSSGTEKVGFLGSGKHFIRYSNG